jgi:hypothetical protein
MNTSSTSDHHGFNRLWLSLLALIAMACTCTLPQIVWPTQSTGEEPAAATAQGGGAQGGNPVMVGEFPSTIEVINNVIAYNMWDPAFSERDYAFVAGYPEEAGPPKLTLILENNIFAFNTGPDVEPEPTGIYIGPDVSLTENHNLYWSCEDGEIQADFVNGHDPFFTRTEIADDTWTTFTDQGQGDLILDPLFVAGWLNVDFHLQAGSPAIDAGTADDNPTDDMEGRSRDATPEIGAYEHK